MRSRDSIALIFIGFIKLVPDEWTYRQTYPFIEMLGASEHMAVGSTCKKVSKNYYLTDLRYRSDDFAVPIVMTFSVD
jgi:hypothetical protein